MNRGILILAFIVALPFIGNAQRKRAFMMGISDYKVWNNIHGAEDIALLTPVLEKKGFTILSLTNEQATYQDILNSLADFINKSKKGDIIYIHFSCHGQPVEDGLNEMPIDEKNGWDEALVPIDAGKEYSEDGYQGESHITDDELNGYIIRLRKKIGAVGIVYVAIDACHAGTMSRVGIETVRGTNEGLSKTGKKFNPSKEIVRHYPVSSSSDMSPVLFIEACQSHERNTEIRIESKEYESLSYNIWQALKSIISFDKKTKEKFKASIEASTKINGRWPRTQTFVMEECP
ncbi:MAG: caspase family protein [Prevotella sp.]|nr:caspase family protein [Prevotella sp.]